MNPSPWIECCARGLGIVALWCGLALLASCAQVPTKPSAGASGALSASQGREAFAAAFAQVLKQDRFYEDVLKVSPALPSFGAFKVSMTELYTDPVVVDWLYDQLHQGRGRDEVFRDMGGRLFRGMLRLDDAQSMQMLDAMGEMTGRLSPAQCDSLLKPREKRPEGDDFIAKILVWMTPDETRRFFTGLHASLRADLGNAPMRAMPTRDQSSVMFAALGKEVPSAFARSSGNACLDLSRIVAGVSRLQGTVRSHAITYVLYMMGLGRPSAARAVA
ncbi:MAG: hypothetical protein KF891_24370 [Rhizobacter sp.]|nr:hypothetical protein [Rhizobacter sp.]